MRGRLIRPLVAAIRQLDVAATRAASGFDDSLRSVRTSRPFGARGERVSARVEKAEVRVLCQYEPARTDAQRMGPGGNVPTYQTAIVCHCRDLERNGLIDEATGKPTIGVNDRVAAIYTRSGKLVRAFVDPEVYIVEVRDAGVGLGADRNLIVFVLSDRPEGATGNL